MSIREMLERYSVEVLPKTFVDNAGRVWPTPTIAGRLRFKNGGASTALRRTVFIRDAFTCVECGVHPSRPPKRYTGRNAVSLGSKGCLVVDHILSRRNGGAHHPDNMRTLCSLCNRKKVSISDRPVGKEMRQCG